MQETHRKDPHPGDIYSCPGYYDIAFNVYRGRECDFLERCFKEHGLWPIRRVLDIACGTGQHLLRLMARGYEMAGLDLSAENIAYIRQQAQTKALSPKLFLGNMINFRVLKPFDAAICMHDSQGHLLTNEDIIRHFRCVARAVRPGGLYIFDRMIPSSLTNRITRWNWTRRRGQTIVKTKFRTLLGTDPVSQICWEQIIFEITENGHRRVVRRHYPTRLVFPQELRMLIQMAGGFKLVAWYPDFDLDRLLDEAKRPTLLVAVLRRFRHS